MTVAKTSGRETRLGAQPHRTCAKENRSCKAGFWSWALVVIDHGRVIARGTADELKALVGGDRLELHTLPGDDPHRLANAVASLTASAPAIDVAAGRVVLPVRNGPAILLELAARLSAAELRVADLALRKPTLEDVFLALTDHRLPAGAGTRDDP